MRFAANGEKRRYATGASAGMPPIEFILYSIIERDL
jgi:hypothetical protein